MAVRTQIPATNVAAIDIYDTLTDKGGSVSYDLLSFFKSAAKINPWSQYKPISVAKDFIDIPSSTWGTYNYGIMPVTGSAKEVLSKIYNHTYNSTSVTWTYKLPTGGASSPYRLGDFRLYNPNATSPFYEISTDTNAPVITEAINVDLLCRFESSNGMLGLNDLGDLSGKYAALVVGNISTGSVNQVIYSSKPISSHHGMVSFSLTINTAGTYFIAPAIGINKTGTSDTFYVLPVKGKSLTWTTAITSTTFDGQASVNSSGYLDCTVNMTCAPNLTSITFSNIQIQIGYAGFSGTGYIYQGTVASSKTVAGGSRGSVYNGNLTINTSYIPDIEAGKITYRFIANNGSYTTQEKILNINL